MEREKAIEILRTMLNANAEEDVAACMGADALGKQIPAPLTAKLYCRGGYFEIYCPCGKKVSYSESCCRSCGQALDWNAITAEVIGPYCSKEF